MPQSFASYKANAFDLVAASRRILFSNTNSIHNSRSSIANHSSSMYVFKLK